MNARHTVQDSAGHLADQRIRMHGKNQRRVGMPFDELTQCTQVAFEHAAETLAAMGGQGDAIQTRRLLKNVLQHRGRIRESTNVLQGINDRIAGQKNAVARHAFSQ